MQYNNNYPNQQDRDAESSTALQSIEQERAEKIEVVENLIRKDNLAKVEEVSNMAKTVVDCSEKVRVKTFGEKYKPLYKASGISKYLFSLVTGFSAAVGIFFASWASDCTGYMAYLSIISAGFAALLLSTKIEVLKHVFFPDFFLTWFRDGRLSIGSLLMMLVLMSASIGTTVYGLVASVDYFSVAQTKDFAASESKSELESQIEDYEANILGVKEANAKIEEARITWQNSKKGRKYPTWLGKDEKASNDAQIIAYNKQIDLLRNDLRTEKSETKAENKEIVAAHKVSKVDQMLYAGIGALFLELSTLFTMMFNIYYVVRTPRQMQEIANPLKELHNILNNPIDRFFSFFMNGESGQPSLAGASVSTSHALPTNANASPVKVKGFRSNAPQNTPSDYPDQDFIDQIAQAITALQLGGVITPLPVKTPAVKTPVKTPAVKTPVTPVITGDTANNTVTFNQASNQYGTYLNRLNKGYTDTRKARVNYWGHVVKTMIQTDQDRITPPPFSEQAYLHFNQS